MLAPAREALREHAEYVARSRQVWQAAQNGAGTARPFAAGGAAVRSDTDHEVCPECAKIGATAAESALIHLDPAPPPVPASFDESQLAAYPYQPDEAEHYRAGGYAESVISR
jgi:hypothetical protein